MFEYCINVGTLDGLSWLSCYLTTGKHLAFYKSFGTVMMLIFMVAPLALLFGFYGSFAMRSNWRAIRWFGWGYSSVVRGVPDIVFFLFAPIALDQLIEVLRHKWLCSASTEPIWRGNDFVVCTAAKMPVSNAAAWVHDTYGFLLAVVAFAIVMGAFVSNVLDGALKSVPSGQIEAGRAVGLSRRRIRRLIEIPQMWIFALPGLSNLWQLLIKATPLLFLLGIEDIVYWARELGGQKTTLYTYAHPDWRIWYFTALIVFYLLVSWASQQVFEKVHTHLSRIHNKGES